MQTPTFPALQTRYKNSATNGFLATHPIGEIARGAFVSSIGWVVMAAAVYEVYSVVVGGH